MLINDGRTNDTVHVDTNNRLKTSGVHDHTQDHAAEHGAKFNMNSGDLTLTSAVKTSVLYIKNNEDADLVLTSFIYNLGTSTNGSGDVLIDIIRNPSAGEIIDNANDAAIGGGVMANYNFGSNITLSADIYKGASGEAAFTNGSMFITTRSATNATRLYLAIGALVIPKGSTLGVNYTPPAGNTSQIAQFAAACYLKTTEVEAP